MVTDQINQRFGRNVALLGIAQVFLMASTMTLLTFTALVGQMLAADPLWATIPIVTHTIGLTITTMPASLLMKRYGRKAVFHLGAMSASISAILVIIAILYNHFALLCLATVFHGVYNAIGAYYRFAAVEVSPKQFNSKAISYVLSGGILAALLAPYINNYLNDYFAPITFMGAFVMILVASLLAHIPIYLLQIPKPSQVDQGPGLEEEKNTKVNVKALIRRPIFICSVANAGGGYLLMSMMMTASPLAVVGCGFLVSDAATVIQFHVVAMFAPAFFTGHLVNRFGSLPIMFSGMVIYILAAMLAIQGIELSNFYVSLVLAGVGWNFMFTASTSLLTEVYKPSEKAFVQGLNDFFVFGMQGLAALTSGLVYELFGWTTLNIIVLIITIVIFAITSWYAMIRKKETLATI